MPLNFPNSPVDGQTYYDSTSTNRYVYNASNGVWVYAANNFPVSTSDTQVIFNDQGSFAGNNGLVFAYLANTLYANTVNVTGYLYGNGAFLTGVSSSDRLANTSGVSFVGDLYFPTGNVGIGITTPTSQLHVVGNANVSNNLRVGGNVSFDNIDSVRIWEPAANTLTVHTASTERLRIDANGRIYVGAIPSAGIQFYLSGNYPSTTDAYGFFTDQTVSSTTTGSAAAVLSNPSTAAAAFTLSSLNHFVATQGTIGAGSAVTNQRGFYALNTLTGATNNYGFYSDIAFGSNRWNFYASGTAYNFFQGGTGFGNGPTAYTQQRIGGTGPSSSNLTYSVYADQTAPATTTSEFASFYSIPNTTASAFTLGTLFHFVSNQGTIGAGSAITNQFGFYAASNMTGATNNYGFYSNISLGANRWNFFANGTANNYFGGNIGVGTTPTYKLDVTGTSRIGNGVAQGNPNATDITANAQLLVSGQGGNYLSFGQYGSAGNFAQWIQSGFSNPTTATYNIVLNPLGGNVGIGISTPSSLLHVAGNANVSTNLRVGGNVSFDNIDSVRITEPAANTLTIHTASTERVRVDASGNVGIGTINPVYKLDVNGTLNVSSGGAIAGGFTVASFNAGANIAAYGTWTPNPANGNYQYVTSNGAVTIAVPASNCAIDVLWYNGTAPGSVTFSGYQAASGGGGDSYLTTSSTEYILMIRRINGFSTYVWKALQ